VNAEIQEDARARSRLGEVIAGKWRLDELLGIGGQSVVYAATHRNGNRAAIKLTAAPNEVVRTRLLREAYAANQLAAHGAVAVLDDGVQGDEFFLVMDLLEGETLARHMLEAGGRLALDEALPLVIAMLSILAAAHARGIVHRDVKPENVFLTRDKAVRLLDFGLARFEGPTASPDGITRSGTMLGTPAFMAPEQALGRTREIDARTDVWCAGATFFTLLTGRHVHDAEAVGEMLVKAGSRPAPSVLSHLPHLPGAVARVIDRALAFSPKDRYADAGCMLAALSAARDAPEDSARPSPLAVTVPETVPSPSAVTLPETGLSPSAPPDAARPRWPRGRLAVLAASFAMASFAVLAATSGLRGRGAGPAAVPAAPGSLEAPTSAAPPVGTTAVADLPPPQDESVHALPSVPVHAVLPTPKPPRSRVAPAPARSAAAAASTLHADPPAAAAPAPTPSDPPAASAPPQQPTLDELLEHRR
jgi:serine/threonine-protein kinase